MSSFNFYDVEQNTEEWFGMRAGKLTSSSLSKVMANYGKSFGDPAKQLAVNIALEQVTGVRAGSSYSNEHMDRGHEQEPIARTHYEAINFCEVSNGGFFDNGFMGCSPDGLVREEGVIEIKSALPHVHYARVKRGGLDPVYKWQCISNLEQTGRDWLDFISFCPDFPEDQKMFCYRVHKGQFQEEVAMIEDRATLFSALVEETKEKIMGSKYIINVERGEVG